MSQDIGKKTKDGLYWSLALKIPYEAIKFINSILVARILDPKDFGIVSIATLAIYYSNTFTNFGFNQALVQRKEVTQDHINSVFSFDMVLSLALGVLMFIMAPYVARYFSSPESSDVIRVLSIVFILTTVHDLPYVLLRREVDFKLISLVDMLREISMSLLTLIFAYMGMKYWSMVYGHIIPLFVAAIYLLLKSNVSLQLKYTHSAIMELSNFSIWSFVQMQIYFLSNRIDRIIIGRALDTAMLGLYEKSKSISQMPSESLAEKVNTVFFSSFSRAQNDNWQIRKYFNKSLVVTSAINFPIYFGMYILAYPFVHVMLGDKWDGIVEPFKIMALAGVFATINGMVSALAVSTGHYKQYTKILTLCVLVFSFAAMMLVSNGISSVAFAYVLYAISLFVFSYASVKKIYQLKIIELILSIAPALASSMVMSLVIIYLQYKYFYEINFVNLTVLTIGGGVFYIISMFLVPSRQLEEIRRPLINDLYKLVARMWRY